MKSHLTTPPTVACNRISTSTEPYAVVHDLTDHLRVPTMLSCKKLTLLRCEVKLYPTALAVVRDRLCLLTNYFWWLGLALKQATCGGQRSAYVLHKTTCDYPHSGFALDWTSYGSRTSTSCFALQPTWSSLQSGSALHRGLCGSSMVKLRNLTGHLRVPMRL